MLSESGKAPQAACRNHLSFCLISHLLKRQLNGHCTLGPAKVTPSLIGWGANIKVLIIALISLCILLMKIVMYVCQMMMIIMMMMMMMMMSMIMRTTTTMIIVMCSDDDSYNSSNFPLPRIAQLLMIYYKLGDLSTADILLFKSKCIVSTLNTHGFNSKSMGHLILTGHR